LYGVNADMVDVIGDAWKEGVERTEARHDAEEDLPTRSNNTKELRDGLVGSINDIADWASEADDGVELAGLKPRQINDVRNRPILDVRAETVTAVAAP
jgi:hypothetical protein